MLRAFLFFYIARRHLYRITCRFLAFYILFVAYAVIFHEPLTDFAHIIRSDGATILVDVRFLVLAHLFEFRRTSGYSVHLKVSLHLAYSNMVVLIFALTESLNRCRGVIPLSCQQGFVSLRANLAGRGK